MIPADRRIQCAILHGIVWVMLVVLPVICRGDQFAILESDFQAMQARVDLIEQAEHQICLAYHAVDLGIVPVATMELLRQASCRGVSVRIVVDGLISRVPSDLEAYLRGSGIQIRVYHAPLTGQPQLINRRIHDKCMIVDRHHLILGSRNLKDEHFGLDKQNYTDCDAYASGAIGGLAQHYFDWLWQQPDLVDAPSSDSCRVDILQTIPQGRTEWERAWRKAKTDADYQRLLTRSLVDLARRMPIQYHSGHDWAALSTTVCQAGLIHDRYTDKRDLQFEGRIISLIDQARVSVLIETPYPVFTPAVCQSLTRAAKRGVDVSVLTNSLSTTDRVVVYAAYQNDKRKLLAAGVRLYEISGENHFHAKSMVIDDRIFTLGSYNFDPRSSRSNLELNLICYDAPGAELMRDSILRRAQGSTQIRIENLRPIVGRDATIAERIKMQSARLAVTAIRWLL